MSGHKGRFFYTLGRLSKTVMKFVAKHLICQLELLFLEQEIGLSLKEARSKLSELKKGLAVLLHKHVHVIEVRMPMEICRTSTEPRISLILILVLWSI